MGEIIDLNAARKERWLNKIHRMRELGEVAVFGVIGEIEAQIIPFERNNDGRDPRSNAGYPEPDQPA